MKRELSSKHQKGLVLSCTTTYVKKKADCPSKHIASGDSFESVAVDNQL